MQKWIAEESFRCIPGTGKKFTLHVRIGEPETIVEDGVRSAFGSVCVSLLPLVDERRVGGINPFQALCLSIDYVRRVLKVFVSEGGRVYWRDTDGPVDLDSPCFLPMQSLSDFKKLTGRRKSAMNPPPPGSRF